jgi:hypothetical protein
MGSLWFVKCKFRAVSPGLFQLYINNPLIQHYLPLNPTNPPFCFSLNISETLEVKWNLEGRFDILVTEPCFENLFSCLLSSRDSMSF